VYFNLFMSCLFATLGVYAQMSYNLDGILVRLTTIALGAWLSFTTRTLEERQTMLAAIAGLSGVSMGNLISVALWIDPAILISAVAVTGAIFACFSYSALTSRRRSYFYLAGIISSAMSMFFVMSAVMWFFPSPSVDMNQAYLYLTTAATVGYICVDTQVIIERSEQSGGQSDPVKDSFMLFLDLIGLFKRILILMLQMQAKREEDERRRRNNDRRR